MTSSTAYLERTFYPNSLHLFPEVSQNSDHTLLAVSHFVLFPLLVPERTGGPPLSSLSNNVDVVSPQSLGGLCVPVGFVLVFASTSNTLLDGGEAYGVVRENGGT